MHSISHGFKLHRYINFEKTYYILALLYALLVPFIKPVAGLLGLVFLALWLLEGNLRSKFKTIFDSRALTAILLYSGYMGLTLLWSSDMKHAKLASALLLLWILIPVLATSIKKKYIPHIITAFLSGMFISEMLAYGMIFELWTIHGHGPEYPSPYMHHVPYSIFLALTATILLYRIFSKEYSILAKAGMLFFFLSVSGNLFFSIGRTGQLALIAAILSAFILHYRLTWKSLLGAFVFIGVLFSSAYVVSSNFQERVQQIGGYATKFSEGDLRSSWGQRVCYMLMTYEVLKEKPLFGAGIGDLNAQERLDAIAQLSHYDYKIPVRLLQEGHLHNQFLMVAFQGGLVGLILFLYLIYRMVRLDIGSKELKDLSLIFLIIFAVGAVAESIAYRQYPMGLFVLFSALFIAASLPDGKTSDRATPA